MQVGGNEFTRERYKRSLNYSPFYKTHRERIANLTNRPDQPIYSASRICEHNPAPCLSLRTNAYGGFLPAMRLQSMRLYSPLMLRTKIDSVSLIEEGDLLALSLVENGVHVHYLVNKENKFAGGVNTAMLQLRQITFDAQLDDSRFKP